MIDKLQVGSEVYIEAELEGNNVEFKTKIIELTEEADLRVINVFKKQHPKLHLVLAEPVRYDGYIITFDSTIVTQRIITRDDEKIIAWEKPSIVNIKLPLYGRCNLLVSQLRSKRYDRRKFYRQDINTAGKIQVNNEIYDVLVKDISAAGIGVFVDDRMFEPLEECVISFKDEQTGDNFKMRCKVIRADENEKGQVIGFKFEESDAIAKYVSKKQFLQRNPEQAWRLKK